MTDRQLSCPVCGNAEVGPVTAPRHVRADDGTMLEFTDQFNKCGRCGEEFYTRDQSLASSRAAASVVRGHENLLSPERIRAIRLSYQMTQADFERALRLGPKTVVRWESGTVRQSAIANSLLLAIEGNSIAFAKVAEANGVQVGAVAQTASAGTVIVYPSQMEQMFAGHFVTYAVASTTADTGSSSRRYEKFRKIKPAPPKRVKIA